MIKSESIKRRKFINFLYLKDLDILVNTGTQSLLRQSVGFIRDTKNKNSKKLEGEFYSYDQRYLKPKKDDDIFMTPLKPQNDENFNTLNTNETSQYWLQTSKSSFKVVTIFEDLILIFGLLLKSHQIKEKFFKKFL